MARLNEPPMSTDSIEILRKKFLRQNRDIARINSTQSLRIRGLENECARLLSENLDLRRQVLRLENDTESSSARRIADHALEIKAKMEMQLGELGSMLAGLGLEPAAKRRSLSYRIDRNPHRPKGSPRRRSCDVAKDSEALAAQEGRLPPIYENKTYPRATMNSAEILALCSQAEEVDSPELGPPPVSRFVVDDDDRIESPSRKISSRGASPSERTPMPMDFSSPLKLDFNRIPAARPEVEASGTFRADPDAKTANAAKCTDPKESVPSPMAMPLKMIGKRKFGDENEPIATSRDSRSKKAEPDGVFPAENLMKNRSVKDTSNGKRGRAANASANKSRRPLAVKHTNEDLLSPVKPPRAPKPDDAKSARMGVFRESSTKEDGKQDTKVPTLSIPESIGESPTRVFRQENGLPDAHDAVAIPDTPNRTVSREVQRDTPPPADILSEEDNSRASRRARQAVSYVEPNLRDKMRRPTKELADAVTGVVKYSHRPAKAEDGQVLHEPKVKIEAETGSTDLDWRKLPVPEAISDKCTRRDKCTSPLTSPLTRPSTATDFPPEILPSTVLLQRGKRTCTVGRRSLVIEHEQRMPEPQGRNETEQDPVRETLELRPEPLVDMYDFETSTSGDEPKEAPQQPKLGSGRPSRATRRMSAAASREVTVETVQASAKSRCGNTRKRTSMAVLKSQIPAEREVEDSRGNEDRHSSETVKDRVSRRKSMIV